MVENPTSTTTSHTLEDVTCASEDDGTRPDLKQIELRLVLYFKSTSRKNASGHEGEQNVSKMVNLKLALSESMADPPVPNLTSKFFK